MDLDQKDKMKNKELLTKAITSHFACDKNNLICDLKLESFTSVANDFYQYFLTGSKTQGFEKAIESNRYRTKLILIERYIKQNEL